MKQALGEVGDAAWLYFRVKRFIRDYVEGLFDVGIGAVEGSGFRV